MEKNILLTVAIPTFNRKEPLKRALDSVLRQVEDDVEVLVVDNASDDGTDAMVATFQKQYPTLQYEKNSENIGADRNFLKCLRDAKGKYVLLLGSDDVLLNGAIQHITGFLREHDVSAAFLNHVFFSGEFHGLEGCTAPFSGIAKDIETADKNIFMTYAKEQITFMSAIILKRENVAKVENPERFIGTNFLHTCLFFASTYKKTDTFGIIATPCVADDSSRPILGDNGFYIFGTCMHHVYCEIAPQYGYDTDEMLSIYNSWLKKAMLRSVANSKIIGNFHYDIYEKNILKLPNMKQMPVLQLECRVYALIPTKILKIAKGIYRKIKYKNEV